jgi:hypothetical protein
LLVLGASGLNQTVDGQHSTNFSASLLMIIFTDGKWIKVITLKSSQPSLEFLENSIKDTVA